MKLSELLIDYRKRMNISQREFSRRCDLSNTYISFIENEKNPKTGKPIIPTLEQYKKLADGMGISVHQLFQQLDDDAPVDLRSSIENPEDVSAGSSAYIPNDPQIRIVSNIMENMTEDQKEQIVAIVRAVVGHQPH